LTKTQNCVLFCDPAIQKSCKKQSRGILGIPSVIDTEYSAYLEPRRRGLLERPIIKVMATFQVDFRVARSERPPPGRPITVTKGLAVLPPLSGLLSPVLVSPPLYPGESLPPAQPLCPSPFNNCICSSLIFDRYRRNFIYPSVAPVSFFFSNDNWRQSDASEIIYARKFKETRI
jgi:hypothetical protein